MRKLGLLILLITLAALANPATPHTLSPETVRFSTAGWNATPTHGGSHHGWGEWFVTTFHNDTGYDVTLTEIGMPCCGAPSGDYGWLVWASVGGMNRPSSGPTGADWYGPYTPADSSYDTNPPTTYTYVDISAENVVIQAGSYFAVGYDVTGMGGHVSFNGHASWAWYGGGWSYDGTFNRTAVIQVEGFYDESGIVNVTWGSLKALD